jgi:hypothetical protein
MRRISLQLTVAEECTIIFNIKKLTFCPPHTHTRYICQFRTIAATNIINPLAVARNGLFVVREQVRP